MQKHLIRKTYNEYRRHSATFEWRYAYRDQYSLYDRLRDRMVVSRIHDRKLILERIADSSQHWLIGTDFTLNEFLMNMRDLIKGVQDFDSSPLYGRRIDRLVTMYLKVFHMYRFLQAHKVDVPKLPLKFKKDFAEKIRFAQANDRMTKYPDPWSIYVRDYVDLYYVRPIKDKE